MRAGNWIYTVPLRLRSLFRRNRVEEELAEEMRDHMERLMEQHMARGANPEQARYAALRAMDGMEQRKEQCRDARRVRYIEDFLKDVRFALRTMSRNPIFTLTAMISLALGIGATTAVFSVVYAIVVDPFVTVAVVEYASRPINVTGAVHKPLTFQAVGPVTLLDAIARAEGLNTDAGPEILVSRPGPDPTEEAGRIVQRIPAKALMDEKYFP